MNTKRPRKKIRAELENLSIEIDASLSLADDFAKRGQSVDMERWLTAVQERINEAVPKIQGMLE